MWGGCFGQEKGGPEPSVPSEQQMQKTGFPGVAVPWLLVWIKEQHGLGGADLVRGLWPSTQAWNEFAQFVTKSGHCCLAGPFATHPASQDLLGTGHGQGLPAM